VPAFLPTFRKGIEGAVLTRHTLPHQNEEYSPRDLLARTSALYGDAMLGSLRLRTAIVAGGCALLLGGAGLAFWYEDVRFSLPTPKPPGLVQPPMGATMPVERWLLAAGVDAGARPVLVNFFNPECPCSRFNVDHLHRLQAMFGDRVLFVAAIQASDVETSSVPTALAKLELQMPYFIDHGGVAAKEAGVYSTPQAVVVDAGHRLFYRGNYNTSRYCNDPKTEFVRLALDDLLATESETPNSALTSSPTSESVRRVSAEMPAYGCELPANKGVSAAIR
jgi:hypothetical protein